MDRICWQATLQTERVMRLRSSSQTFLLDQPSERLGMAPWTIIGRLVVRDQDP